MITIGTKTTPTDPDRARRREEAGVQIAVFIDDAKPFVVNAATPEEETLWGQKIAAVVDMRIANDTYNRGHMDGIDATFSVIRAMMPPEEFDAFIRRFRAAVAPPQK